jgi:ribonuclease R
MPRKVIPSDPSRLAAAPARVLGVFRPTPGGGGRIVPTDRRAKAEWLVPPGEEGNARAEEIVLATPLPARRYGLQPARVLERLGVMGDARSVSAIVIHAHGIVEDFSPAALAEAERARPIERGTRTDLSALPLVTIDGEDARDFDDAVFAAADGDGFRLLVAIADVAHYVRPGSALDEAARLRGNSCYFPDRVVPMLPAALSNGWCSLRPGEDRGCLFVEVRIDAAGNKIAHRFGRGLMRSAARLTYEQVQAAHDAGDDLGLPLGALWSAFGALARSRSARGTLDLDLPERRIVLDAAGRVASVTPRPRLESHRLIEEFMILANVSAAEELERLHQPCVWRVHAPPSEEKLAALREFLRPLRIALPPGRELHPRALARVLQLAAGTAHAPLVNEVMLRSQSQAEYAVDNIGHFGLALPRYAHFTSPIRRYADLLVHRALIRGLHLGEDGLAAADLPGLAACADHITATERRAALAERDAFDRYLAAYLADQVGAVFAARISGVTRFGLFVTVTENGANGLVPVSSLRDDAWSYDEVGQTLSGRHTRITWRLAEEVDVLLAEASPVTGSLVFHILDATPAASRRGKPPRPPRSGAEPRRGRPRTP